MALGAIRRQLVRLVLGKGLALTAAGLLVGLFGALLARGVLSRFLHGVGESDWLGFAATPLVLATAAFIACFIPARRAAAVDPARTLRQD